MPKPTLMPLDKVVLTPEFLRLKPRHAEWTRRYLQSYIQTGIFDHTAATMAVYPSQIPQRIRSKSHMLVHHPKVKAVVELFLTAGMRELDKDLAEIQRAIDSADPGGIAQQRLIILKARLKYGTKSGVKTSVAVDQLAENSKPQGPSTAPTSTIGTIVDRDGLLYRVTAEDERFVPTDGTRVDKNGVEIPDDSPIDFVAEATR